MFLGMDGVALSVRSTSLVARTVAGVLWLSGVAAGAPAPTHSDVKPKARALYSDGLKALERGNVEAAQRDFEEAYRTLPNAAVLLKIAECRTRRSDYRGAVGALEQYMRDRPDAPERVDVESRLSELRKKPGFVSVTTAPAGASIWVDGADSGHTAPFTLELAPGDHFLAAKVPSYEVAEQKVVVEFDSKQEVSLTLHGSDAASRSGNAESGTSAGETGYHTTPPFWIAVGVTAVGAVVTTTFGIMALEKHSDYEEHPTKELYDSGKRDALIADISLGVTAAAAVTAGILFFTSKGPEKRSDQAFVLAPSFERQGGGLVGRGRF
jgi:hypothetical protein